VVCIGNGEKKKEVKMRRNARNHAPCGFDQTFSKFDAWCESMRGQTPIGVIPKPQLPNPKIATDDGGELLVSPEHRVYGTIVDQTNPSSSFNSGVDTTGTLFSTISLNSGSLDQILMCPCLNTLKPTQCMENPQEGRFS